MINPKLLEKFSINLTTKSILEWWSDSSREFYNLDYLKLHLDQVTEDYFCDRISESQRDLVSAFFLFENIITPQHKIEHIDNSSLFLEKYCMDNKNSDFINLHRLVSKSTPFGLLDVISLSEKYKSKIWKGDFDELKKWESAFLREYEGIESTTTRIAFYQDLVDEVPENTQAILEVIDWLQSDQF